MTPALHAVQVCGASKAVEREVRGSGEGWGGRPGVSAGVHDELLAQPAMCEQFVALLCRFEPSAVLPFLQSHDSYRLPHVMLLLCLLYPQNAHWWSWQKSMHTTTLHDCQAMLPCLVCVVLVLA